MEKPKPDDDFYYPSNDYRAQYYNGNRDPHLSTILAGEFPSDEQLMYGIRMDQLDIQNSIHAAESVKQFAQRGTIDEEKRDKLLAQIAENFTRNFVASIRSGKLNPEYQKNDFQRHKEVIGLTDEQVNRMQKAENTPSINLATATLAELRAENKRGGFQLEDIDKIEDKTFLVFIAESISHQIDQAKPKVGETSSRDMYQDTAFGMSVLKKVAAKLNPNRATITEMVNRVAIQAANEAKLR